MRSRINVIVFFVIAAILLTAAGCGSSPEVKPAVDADREGNPIILPNEINKIISMGPSNTEILVALGLGEKIIAIDTYSENIEGVQQGVPLFDMMAPDGEQMINLAPDVIFVTGMTKVDGGDMFKTVTDMGICVIYIPASSSIEGIKEDIRYISVVMGEEQNGEKLLSDMEGEISNIKKIGDTIADKKTVYFEISAAPDMYSFGKGVFLNEMIELVGAQNIFAEQESWMPVGDEAVLNADPDVILTSVDYVDNTEEEIKSRPGWEEITAVKNGDVYYIDTDASNRPSHNIIKALKEIARAVYPDLY